MIFQGLLVSSDEHMLFHHLHKHYFITRYFIPKHYLTLIPILCPNVNYLVVSNNVFTPKESLYPYP